MLFVLTANQLLFIDKPQQKCMLPEKKIPLKEKSKLHPRSKHRERYNFKSLIAGCPDLAPFVKPNLYGDESIDFANPEAVKTLNKALLKLHYGINFWDIPKNYLCPPIPGRADYIHHIADLLCASNYGMLPKGISIKCLDIGVGASCIYPIIGHIEYGWSFIGSDIDAVAIASSNRIIEQNPILKNTIELRLQPNQRDIFYNIITRDENIDITICNPPFHSSLEAAQTGTLRKLTNLNKQKTTNPILNFGGQNAELWCDGGEKRFINDLIRQSKKFSETCFWFSTLVSKQTNLKGIYKALKNDAAVEVRTIPMGQGNKTSRIVAWTFLSSEQQKNWKQTKWKTAK